MFVQWPVAACDDLESVFKFMAIEMDEHSAMGNVVWWDMAEKSAIVKIFERLIPARSVELRKSIDEFANQMV